MKIPSNAAALIVLAAMVFGMSPVQAEESWTPPGPAVGERFPSTLNLPDQAGVGRDLASLQGKNGVVLVFVRSADWCPICMRQLADLNARLSRFEALGLAVVSVSVDPVADLARFHSEQKIGYTMVADTKGTVVQALGIRDPAYGPDSRAFGVPQPVIFVLDRKQIVRAKFAEHGYRNRPDLDRVLEQLAGLDLG
ncbi:MAG: peroxiredoxin family protein [Steroidobacteraceae bacterium]